MKTIYIVSDSRGVEMDTHITPPTGYRIRVYSEGGATLQRLLTMAKSVINAKPCELIYILGGICSITEKDKGIVELPFESADEVYQMVKELYKAVVTDLDSYDTTPVILCQLVGVDLKTANDEKKGQELSKKKGRGKKHPKQDIMNEAILRLNTYIRLLNTERGHETPELGAAVHKHHGQKGWSHSYSHLRDGIHPTPQTQKYWAKRFEENIGLFLKK